MNQRCKKEGCWCERAHGPCRAANSRSPCQWCFVAEAGTPPHAPIILPAAAISNLTTTSFCVYSTRSSFAPTTSTSSSLTVFIAPQQHHRVNNGKLHGSLCAVLSSLNLHHIVLGGNRSASGLGGSPLQHEEFAILLSSGYQRLAVGTTSGNRPGEAQGVHGTTS